MMVILRVTEEDLSSPYQTLEHTVWNGQVESVEQFKLVSLASILEKAMAPHSSTLAWKIPWTEEPGRLQPMGSLRVGHD